MFHWRYIDPDPSPYRGGGKRGGGSLVYALVAAAVALALAVAVAWWAFSGCSDGTTAGGGPDPAHHAPVGVLNELVQQQHVAVLHPTRSGH